MPDSEPYKPPRYIPPPDESLLPAGPISGPTSRRKHTRVTPAMRRHWYEWLQEHSTSSYADGARHFNRHYKTFYLHIRAYQRELDALGDEPGSTPPVPYEELSDKARAAWDDFGRFFEDYIAPTLPDWRGIPAFQREIIELIDKGDHHYLLLHIAPGMGKSVLLLSYVIWRLLRDRQVRVVYLTKSKELAKDGLAWIVAQFEENENLLRDFGRFKPAKATTWTKTELMIEGALRNRKAKSLAVFGAGQKILGTRPDIILADDVVDDSNSLTPEDRTKLKRWWHDVVEPRLEPGGTLAVVGQRLSPSDLYAHLAGVLTGDATPMYHRIRFKVHDNARCPVHNRTGTDHPEYPQGCLLFPARWSYEDVLDWQASKPNFQLIYQQEDVAETDVLVPASWLTGGIDPDGINREGCLDYDRGLGIPCVAGPEALTVITIDPSPTQFWAVMAWQYVAGEWPMWYLIDMRREKMTASDLLDFAPSATGLLQEWVNDFRAKGIPIRYIIPEYNAAQRWLLQSFMARQWAQQEGLKLIPHNTSGINKHDQTMGVWTMRLRFRDGRYRIPYGTPEAKKAVAQLLSELQTYPLADTDDTVMSTWFGYFREKEITPAMRYESLGGSVPSSIRNLRQERKLLP